jgi:uncharacterized membrane protein YciS (DUF1049 family)
MTFAIQLADSTYGWIYVIIGWSLTAVVLAAYYARMVVRIKRAERTLRSESDQ